MQKLDKAGRQAQAQILRNSLLFLCSITDVGVIERISCTGVYRPVRSVAGPAGVAANWILGSSLRIDLGCNVLLNGRRVDVSAVRSQIALAMILSIHIVLIASREYALSRPSLSTVVTTM